MVPLKRLLILVLYGCFFAGPLRAQQLQPLVDSLAHRLESIAPPPSTTIYLSANKDIFVAGEDLWFNAFVLDSRTAALSTLDKLLFLQLVNTQNDSIVWKEMYPIDNGIAAGHVFLPHDLTPGNFLLKAYSAHSFFAQSRPFVSATPIQVVSDPRTIKRYGQLAAARPYSQGLPLQLTVAPAGGQLVADIPNTVVFRASHPAGIPYNVQGRLLRNDVLLQAIQTDHAGIGHFELIPQAGAQYRIIIDKAPDSAFNLPPVAANGVQVKLAARPDSLFCTLQAAGLPPQPVLISLQTRGELQAIASGKLSDSLLVRFPAADLPPGIALVTVYNDQLQPLCSQPVFIQPQQLQIHFSEIKDLYTARERVTVKIKTTDAQGTPIPAMLSLRVHDRLFADRKQVQDILNHYTLSTQLPETLYDPAWYLDSMSNSRTSALNALLQGALPAQRIPTAATPVLPDSLRGTVLPAGKNARPQGPVSLLAFNYNKTHTQLLATDVQGSFYLTPDLLATGRRFFIKYLAEKEHKIDITDPFALIDQAERKYPTQYAGSVLPVELPGKPVVDTGSFQYGHLLEEVVVQAKGRGYKDRYLGYLDSIAKFEGNTDFIGQCGWLNCPACGSGTKPKEGVRYSELTEKKRNQVTSHPFAFGEGDARSVIYKYPVYTEEELLKRFKMIMTKGFYQDRVYQLPDYTVDDKSANDMRNSLYWSPLIVTNEQGEATITFYTSDIKSGFIGIAEGIGPQGALGVGRFTFGVR